MTSLGERTRVTTAVTRGSALRSLPLTAAIIDISVIVLAGLAAAAGRRTLGLFR